MTETRIPHDSLFLSIYLSVYLLNPPAWLAGPLTDEYTGQTLISMS